MPKTKQIFRRTLNTPDSLFATAISYNVGNSPGYVVTGDFNNDGIQDIAAANFLSNSVSVLLGNGDKTFQSAISCDVGSYPQGVTVADFNGDGKLDIAVTNWVDAGTISVAFGNGNGTFGTATPYNVGNHPYGVAVADVNNDGKIDIISTNEYSNNISVLLGNDDGTFRTATPYNVGTNPTGIALADLDRDGNIDAVVSNINSENISVLLGIGNGNFRNTVNYPTGIHPISVAIADIDLDGKLDVITANRDTPGISVLYGSGDGTFQTKIDFSNIPNGYSVAIADVNLDGKPDIINTCTDASLGTVYVQLGNGGRTFQTALEFGIGQNPNGLIIADLGSDNKPDIIVANAINPIGNISVLLNTVSILTLTPTSTTFFTPTITPTVSFSPTPLPSAHLWPISAYQDTASQVDRYVVNIDIVTDTFTDLIWEHFVNGINLVWSSSAVAGSAQAYCANLAKGGFGNWRLPTAMELLSLADDTISGPGPTIDTETFPNTAPEYFWTSSTQRGHLESVRVVDFSQGTPYLLTVDSANVRCVVGVSNSVLDHRYTDENNNPLTASSTQVKDQMTDLIWQRDQGLSLGWDQSLGSGSAQLYCKNLIIGGYGAGVWHLPTFKELYTIVDNMFNNPAISSAAFPNAIANLYYTSTPVASSPGAGLEINFESGTPWSDYGNVQRFARCVRDSAVPSASATPTIAASYTLSPTVSPSPAIGSSITDYEYSALSLYVYGENECSLPAGWRSFWPYKVPPGLNCIKIDCTVVSLTFSDAECCYYAEAYNNTKGSIVIAHRGSQNPIKNFHNWNQNLEKLMNGQLTGYYLLAKSFTDEVISKIPSTSGYKVVAHTGHSLGGHISELMSAKFGIKSVTFDSPGSLSVIENNLAIFETPASSLKTLITTYNAAPHLINTMDDHPGTLYRVYPPYNDVYLVFKINFGSFLFSIQQHSMKGIYDQFMQNTGAAKVISNGYSIWKDDGAPVVGTDNAELMLVCKTLSPVHALICKSGALVLRNFILNIKFYDKYDVNPYYWEQRFDDEDVTSDYRVAKIDGSILYVEYSLGGINSDYGKAGMKITGDNKGNKIWGTTNYADIVNSGSGNDEIWTFSGNDVVTDSGGYDKYHFYLHNMKGKHIINDYDGNGAIYLENVFCNLAGKITIDPNDQNQFIFKPKDNKRCDIEELSGWFGYKHKSDIFLLRLVNNNNDLQITYNAANKKDFPYSGENTIYISNFSGGNKLGISLPNKLSRILQLEEEENVIGTNNNETLSCLLTKNSDIYGLIGFDTYIFYIGSQYNCSLMGNIFDPKVFKAEVVSDENQNSLGIIEIVGFKPGDLLDLSALNISDFYDIGYDVENHTTYFTMPNGQQVILDSSPRDISLSLNESIIFNPIDSGRVAVPKDYGYLFLMDGEEDSFEPNATCNITDDSNNNGNLFTGINTSNNVANDLSTITWIGISVGSFSLGIVIPYIIRSCVQGGKCNFHFSSIFSGFMKYHPVDHQNAVEHIAEYDGISTPQVIGDIVDTVVAEGANG